MCTCVSVPEAFEAGYFLMQQPLFSLYQAFNASFHKSQFTSPFFLFMHAILLPSVTTEVDTETVPWLLLGGDQFPPLLGTFDHRHSK